MPGGQLAGPRPGDGFAWRRAREAWPAAGQASPRIGPAEPVPGAAWFEKGPTRLVLGEIEPGLGERVPHVQGARRAVAQAVSEMGIGGKWGGNGKDGHFLFRSLTQVDAAVRGPMKNRNTRENSRARVRSRTRHFTSSHSRARKRPPHVRPSAIERQRRPALPALPALPTNPPYCRASSTILTSSWAVRRRTPSVTLSPARLPPSRRSNSLISRTGLPLSDVITSPSRSPARRGPFE
jgi:hypothetical protein